MRGEWSDRGGGQWKEPPGNGEQLCLAPLGALRAMGGREEHDHRAVGILGSGGDLVGLGWAGGRMKGA